MVKTKENPKKQKGITLIALVITIIVLLILAGITIATLSGDNGIINQTSEATLNNKKETEREEIRVISSGQSMDYETDEIDFETLVTNVKKEIDRKKWVNNISESKSGDTVTLTVTTDLQTIKVKLNRYDRATVTEYVPAEVAPEDWFTYEIKGEYVTITGLKFENIPHEEKYGNVMYTNNTIQYGPGTEDGNYYMLDIEELIIPEKIENKYVTEVMWNGKDIDDTNPEYAERKIIKGLSKIVYPENLKKISNSYIFEDVETIVLPENLEEIGNYAFWGCYNMDSITISETVTNIGIFPFRGWNKDAIINVQGKNSEEEFILSTDISSSWRAYTFWGDYWDDYCLNVNYLGN